MTLLCIDNLHVHFVARGWDNAVRTARALNGVSLTVNESEIVGLVGETGAGKSLTGLALLGLLRPPARLVSGAITFAGRPLDPTAMAALRGKQIALIPQSPLTSLDPLCRIGNQLVRVQQAHERVPRADALVRAGQLLAEVRIPDPERCLSAWPHELSGGMAQRVLIAMALIYRPRLLIADEPTTGLDVTVQADVLDTLLNIVRTHGMSVLLITHDLGVVAQYCDRVVVMFAGKTVEQAPTRDLFAAPLHPYTRSLIDSTPQAIRRLGYVQNASTPPDLYALPAGCVYRTRCARATLQCEQDPPTIHQSPEHSAQCHHATMEQPE
ncbi:MAG: ABC transporter ATP-binding protein [Burkholderiales bacterium]